MPVRTFVLAFLSCLIALASLQAAPDAVFEKAKIEALISHLEKLKDAKFVLNGKEYDSGSAAKFLRGKWQARDKEIKTASDFIAKVATVSSTSGKPYLIRFGPAKETPCAAYLAGQLKQLEAGTKNPPR